MEVPCEQARTKAHASLNQNAETKAFTLITFKTLNSSSSPVSGMELHLFTCRYNARGVLPTRRNSSPSVSAALCSTTLQMLCGLNHQFETPCENMSGLLMLRCVIPSSIYIFLVMGFKLLVQEWHP